MRLGLPPGVPSLDRTDPDASNSFRRRDSTSASITSDILLPCRFVELSPSSRLDTVGGVFEPAGVGRAGVSDRPVAPAGTALFVTSSMVMVAVVAAMGLIPDYAM